MINALSLSGVALQADVTIPDTTAEQRVIAVVFIVLGVLAAIVGYYGSQIAWLDAEKRQTREKVRAQKRRQNPPKFQAAAESIRAGEVDVRGELRQLFREDIDASDTRMTFRAALGRVWTALSLVWADRVARFPAAAVRAVGWAIAVTIWGAVAVSTGALVSLLERNPSGADLSLYLDRLVEIAHSAVDVVGLFPYGGTLWQLAYAYTILLIDWLYQHWMVPAALLILSAAITIVLDRRINEDDIPEQVVNSWTVPLATAAVVLGMTWVVGTGVSVAVSRLVGPGIGQPVGFVFALIMGIGMAIWAIWTAIRLLRKGISQVAGERTRGVAALLLVRRAIKALSIVAAGLVAMYVVAAVIGGQIGRLVEAFQAADPSMQATVVLAFVAAGMLLATLFREAAGDVRAALHSAMAEKAVRVQIAKRGVPVLAVIAAYILAYSFPPLRSIPSALLVAVIVGAVSSRVVYWVAEARYRANWVQHIRGWFKPSPTYIAWLAYQVEDSHGREHYVVDVNGDLLANADRDQLLEDAEQVGRALANKEHPPATESNWFADMLFDRGIADPDEQRSTLHEKIRKSMFTALRGGLLDRLRGRSAGQIRREKWDQAIKSYPDEHCLTVQQNYRRYLHVDREYVSLARDPWRETDDWEWPSFSD